MLGGRRALNRFRPVLLGAWLAGAPAARAQIDAQAIALNCLNCHDGAASADAGIPQWHAIGAERLRQALLDFKYRDKTATLMPRIAKGYSDDELSAVAAFLAGE